MNSKLFGKKALSVLLIAFVMVIIGSVLLNRFAVKPYIKEQTSKPQSHNIQASENNQANRKKTDDGFIYYIFAEEGKTEKFALITKYDGDEVNVKVPNKIEGYDVTLIDRSCFAYCDKIESIEIPETVKKVEDFAFSGCDKLKTVIIHSSATEFGAYINTSPITFVAPKGSNAETYAENNNIGFSALK
jgi:hypothetical protein